MSILSVYFLVFLLLLSITYYIVPNKAKPLALLAGNLYFYLQFDLRYSLFLLFSMVTVFAGALLLERCQTETAKRVLLGSILFLNFGILFFVQYTPYLLNLAQRFITFDSTGILSTVIVPVGIGFYTLQLCGYLLDVFRGTCSAEKNILKFAAFSTFFPLILQGPIARYDQLAHQVYSKAKRTDIYRNYTYGAQLILWGFFKKLVIADRAAIFVNQVFDHSTAYSGIIVAIATILYAIQIYTDFSGCIDICRGAAQLFSIDVIENFHQPYFARSMQDFWKRWHTSLSSWLQDYLYLPLGGSKKGHFRTYINLLIVFLAMGLWHGTGFHHIAWGMMQGVFLIAGLMTLPLRKKICAKCRINRSSLLSRLIQHLFTFLLINLSWLVFRANGAKAAIAMVKSIVVFSPLSKMPTQFTSLDFILLAVAVLLLFAVSCFKEKGFCVRDQLAKLPLPIRWSVFLLLFAAVLLFGVYGPGSPNTSFPYMRF